MITLSLVIPVYNESKRLDRLFQALQKGVELSGVCIERLIFVDDGSTDYTERKLAANKDRIEQATRAEVRIVSYTPNKGKGYAVRKGLQESASDYTLFMDADMSTPLTELVKFVPYFKKSTPVIIGTRKNGHSTVIKHQPLYRELLGKGFTLLSQLILNTWVTDFTCGFKALAREAKEQICQSATVNRWSYDAEFLFLAQSFGYRIQEVPVVWSNDERTKVNLMVDIPKTLLDLFAIRVSHLSFRPYVLRRLAIVFNLNRQS